MNDCAIQQNDVVRSGAVVCPKPRRVGLLLRPLRRNLSFEADLSDSNARSELLDIILAKGGQSSEITETNYSNTQLGSSSPPFFCGSPPSRVSNPLIEDARFQKDKFTPSITLGLPSSSATSPAGMSGSPTSAAARKGGCVRASFGKNPAVRVEGFDCLDRDRSRNCRILALA